MKKQSPGSGPSEARQLLAGRSGGDVAAPRPSATVLLLRDRPEGYEVFMATRHHQIDFASGAVVFPGGKVEGNDLDPRLSALCQGAPADDYQRSLRIAAIREAYEECGVLLARRKGELLGRRELDPLEESRRQIHKQELALADLLERESLTLACDLLLPFAHWITPLRMPKRFDTHFYLAIAPSDQIAGHDGRESVDSIWIQPRQAVEDGRAQKRTIIFPTMCNLTKLAASDTLEGVLERARSEPIVTVTPWVEKREDGAYLCIPEDAGYDPCAERLPPRS